MLRFKRLGQFFLLFVFATASLLFFIGERGAQAQEPIPIYRGSGNFVAGVGALTTLTFPAGMVANDVCLLVVTSENQAISLTTANGFVEVPTFSPQSAGTAAADPASRLAVFWKRTVGGDTAPVVADSGDNNEGVIHCFSGVITAGNPWDTGAGGNDTAANDTTGNVPGSTTTVDNTLVVLIESTSFNGTSAVQFSAWANTNLANILERQDNSNTAGLGGGSGMATGEKATAGAYGTSTVTLANTSFKGAISLALKPPLSTTTLGDGTNPGDATIAPSGAATEVDSFTFQTSSGTDSITNVTTTLAVNTTSSISKVEITSNDGVMVYGSSTNPTANSFSIATTQNGGLIASTTLQTFKIRITPKTHANMPVPPGSTYTVTSTITAWSGTNTQAGSDATSSVLTIDNLSPANVTSASGTASNAQVSLSWTNPGDADFTTTTVLRATSSIGNTAPVEGTNYATSSTVNATTTVACVTSGGNCIDTGLTNGIAYHYKIFTQDSRGNYATGTVPSGSPFTPVSSPTVSCSTNITSTSFGTLTTGSVSTASFNASTTMSCSNTSLGCTLTVQGAGNGTSPGLATTSPAYLILSVTATLSAGTEGYGIQATTTATGSGGTLGLNSIYNKTGNAVGALSLSAITLASSTIDVTNREVVVPHLAAISTQTQAGSYADTITYSCTAN